MKTAKLTAKDAKSKAIWDNQVKINQDDYGWGVIEVVEKLGANLDKGMSCQEAEKAAIKGSGITGYMAGEMAKFICQLHPRGEEFKKYWNGQFGVDENAKGVVNPAIMTVKDSSDEEN